MASKQFTLQSLDVRTASHSFDPSKDLSIGRAPETCQISFPECALVSRVHCTIFSLGQDVFVTDVSSNGTFVNNKVVGKGNRRMLRAGDVLCVVGPTNPERDRFSWRFIPPKELTSPSSPSTSLVGGIYELKEQLGSGNFATVRLGVNTKTGEKVAVKIIQKKQFAMSADQFSYESMLEEVSILRKMGHDGIIKVHDCFNDDKAFILVLELVDGGDFFDYIAGRCPNPFTEDEGRGLFVQLVEALLYMHSKSVVHRDLKPENILVSIDPTFAVPSRSGDAQQNAPNIPPEKVRLKVTDFGLAKFCGEQDVMKTMCGTPTYLAPEVMHGNGGTLGYSWNVDVWSMGIILYVLLSGTLPVKPQQGIQFPSCMSHLSSSVKNLMEGMLTIDVAKRLDLRGICDHPWLSGMHIRGRELATLENKLTHQGTLLASQHGTQSQSQGAYLSQEAIGLSTADPFGLNAVVTASPAVVDTVDDGPSAKKTRHEVASKGMVAWFWKKDLSLPDEDPAAWQRYPDDDSLRIQRAVERNLQSSKVGTTGEYRISIADMFQYSTKEPTKQRPVKFQSIC